MIQEITGTFDDVGVSEILSVRPGQFFRVTLDGTYDELAVVLERTNNGGATWQHLATYTDDVELTLQAVDITESFDYRLRAYQAAGEEIGDEIAYTLVTLAMQVSEVLDNAGNVIIRVFEDRIDTTLPITTETVTVNGAIFLGTYAVEDLADLPADGNENALIVCTDGDDGDPCLAYSDGTDWLRIALGTTVSAGE